MSKLCYPETQEELLAYLGEAIHTAFRKATDCDQAHPIWKLIQEMPKEDWEAVLDFVALTPDGWGSGLGYGLCKVLQERASNYQALLDTREILTEAIRVIRFHKPIMKGDLIVELVFERYEALIKTDELRKGE